jgi:hypothetical protein
VVGGVVRGVGLPAAPDDVGPGAGEDADGVWVLTVVDPADDGVVGVADVPGVGMPRPVGPGGALVGGLTSWSVQ